jgi:hypothetical protein
LLKSWQGSCGASVGSGWQRLLRTDAGLSASCRLIKETVKAALVHLDATGEIAS